MVEMLLERSPQSTVASLDLVRADDGLIVIQYLVKIIILIVVLVIMAVAIYKCMKKNDEYYNDGDYTTCEYFVFLKTVRLQYLE